MGRKLKSTDTYYWRHREELKAKAKRRREWNPDVRDKWAIRIEKLRMKELLVQERTARKLEESEKKAIHRKSIKKLLSDPYSPTEDKRAQYVNARNRDNRIFFVGELGGKCVRCGIKDPRVMDFDHINPLEKRYNIGDIMWWANRDRIWEEVRKCQLLCANCHRIKTMEDRDYLVGDRSGRVDQTPLKGMIQLPATELDGVSTLAK